MNLLLFKVLVLLSILVSGYLGLIPYVIDKYVKIKHKKKEYVISLGNCFVAGIFLSIAFVHLLNESSETLNKVNHHIPLAFVLSPAGFVLVFMIEKIFNCFEGGSHGHSHGHGGKKKKKHQKKKENKNDKKMLENSKNDLDSLYEHQSGPTGYIVLQTTGIDDDYEAGNDNDNNRSNNNNNNPVSPSLLSLSSTSTTSSFPNSPSYGTFQELNGADRPLTPPLSPPSLLLSPLHSQSLSNSSDLEVGREIDLRDVGEKSPIIGPRPKVSSSGNDIIHSHSHQNTKQPNHDKNDEHYNEGIITKDGSGTDDNDNTKGKQDGPTPIILVFILSIHSIISGFTLGVESDYDIITPLFIGIISHKWLEAMSLGVSLVRNKSTFRETLKLVSLYSVTEPLGVILGVAAAVSVASTQTATSLILAFSSGTFIYIALMDILVVEFSEHIQQSRYTKLLKLLFCIIGFIGMSALTLAFHSEESEGSGAEHVDH